MTTKNVDVQQRAVFGVSNELSEEELASVSGAALNPGGLSTTAKVVHGVGYASILAAGAFGAYEVFKNKPQNFSSL